MAKACSETQPYLFNPMLKMHGESEEIQDIKDRVQKRHTIQIDSVEALVQLIAAYKTEAADDNG
jgi:hypothetical protein